ncbi:MAG TPA: paraquat-inducible protein A [Cellvibrionaceae bacterium]
MRAIDAGLARCSMCSKVSARPPAGAFVCSRCQTPLYFRENHAISRAWAFLLTACVMLIPANLYPIMTVAQVDSRTTSTILGGIVDLAQNDMLPIAIVVFIASIAVPIFKIIGIAILLVIVQRQRPVNKSQSTFMYRFIDIIGRWSMLDLFVISILVSLVSFGNIASIEVNLGATAFGAVVVLTLLAAESFDPRLIWDLQEQQNE